MTNDNTNAQEVSSVLGRVNQLGATTERLFSRLYAGLNRRSEMEHMEERNTELKTRLEQTRRVQERNKQLQINLAERIGEIEKLHGILSTIDEGIIMQDLEGRVAFINRAAREMLGTQKNIWESELGLLFDKYSHITTTTSELEPLGEPDRVQVNNRILGAQLAAVATGRGQRLGTMIVLRDVTRDALADRLKDQFVTAISHELKTPMTVIKGMSEVLMGQPEDAAPNRRLLETLSRNVDILDRMVVELLDVSEMGAGTFDIRQTPVRVEPMLLSIVNGLSPEVKKGRLEVLVMTRDINHLQLYGDEQRLRWAVGHLLQNSIHYTEAGGRVRIFAGVNEANPNFFFVEFEDSGVGISEKDLPHIFERFYRGDPRNTEGKLVDPRGLGQGLFIARTVAEAHGGYLSVRSELGVGSLFTLTLPVMVEH